MSFVRAFPGHPPIGLTGPIEKRMLKQDQRRMPGASFFLRPG